MTVYQSATEVFEAYRRGERPQMVFAKHALTRGVEMGDQAQLSPAEIRQTIESPTAVDWSDTYGLMNLYNGRCMLSVGINALGQACVVTVLWATKNDWIKSYEGGELSGRSRRY